MEEQLSIKKEQSREAIHENMEIMNYEPFFPQPMQEQAEGAGQNALGHAVLADRSKHSDSYEMASIKREIHKLRLMHERKAKPPELICQYNWLLYLCNEKYLPGKGTEGKYALRHQKVRALAAKIEEHKAALLETHPDAAGEVALTEERKENAIAAQEIQNESSTMKKHAANLSAMLSDHLPMNDRDFRRAQGSLLSAYDALIRDYRDIAESFCIRRKAKEKREKAQRILLQLRKERRLVSGYTYDGRAKDKRRTWGEAFVSEDPYLLTDRQLAEGRMTFVAEQAGMALSKLFIDMAKAGDHYASQLKCKREDGTIGYASAKQDTLVDAQRKADRLGIDLTYSAEAISAMETVQLVDMICGETVRSDDEILVTTKMKTIQNREYLVITNVEILNKGGGFTDENFQTLNQQAEDGSKRELVDGEGNLRFSAYDPAVADQIISLDPELIRSYYLAEGLDQPKTDALINRLTLVQNALQKDKETGKRNEFQEAKSKDPDGRNTG